MTDCHRFSSPIYTDENYPEKELTGKVIGVLFEVYNKLGFGYSEKVYQEAIATELASRGIKFHRENLSKISYKDRKIGYVFHDFLIENKVILEVKVGTGLFTSNVSQVLSYLKGSRLRVGLISVFTKERVLIKRVIL